VHCRLGGEEQLFQSLCGLECVGFVALSLVNESWTRCSFSLVAGMQNCSVNAQQGRSAKL
jgi:hypothetical protein